jgi:hypothetical protein
MLTDPEVLARVNCSSGRRLTDGWSVNQQEARTRSGVGVMSMRIRVLGPLSVWIEDEPARLPAGRARNVLAVLALHRGEPVFRHRLIDAVWGDSAPATAATQLQGLVSALRRRLPAGTIETHGPAYLLQVEPSAVDPRVIPDRQVGCSRRVACRQACGGRRRVPCRARSGARLGLPGQTRCPPSQHAPNHRRGVGAGRAQAEQPTRGSRRADPPPRHRTLTRVPQRGVVELDVQSGQLSTTPDPGTQYLSIRYTERLAEAGASVSVGSKRDSYDIALAETLSSQPRGVVRCSVFGVVFGRCRCWVLGPA